MNDYIDRRFMALELACIYALCSYIALVLEYTA